MKLRILGNSIRLRLLRNEVSLLGDKQAVQETTRLGPGADALLRYSLTTHPNEDDIRISWKSGSLTVSLQQELAQELVDTERVSIASNLRFGEEELNVLIEKDFKCLTPRSGEDESDSYENPQEKHGCGVK